MTNYIAQVIHGRTGGEVDHPFEGPAELMSRAPDAVMRFFMEQVIANGHPLREHEDYDISSAHINADEDCVTIVGEFIYSDNSRSPFACMIGHANAAGGARNVA